MPTGTIAAALVASRIGPERVFMVVDHRTDPDPHPDEALEQALDVLTRRLAAPDLVIDHRRAVDDLSAQLAAFGEGLTARPSVPPRPPSVRRRIDAEMWAAQDPDRAEALARLLRIDPTTVRPRQIRWFEPGPPDRVAEVFGDLLTATDLAVVVPDAEADLIRFDDAVAGPAADLYREMARARGPRVATVAWLGYNPADLPVIDLTTDEVAGPAGVLLARWLDDLPVLPGQRRFLLGRGFGELVISAARAAGAVAEPAPERW